MTAAQADAFPDSEKRSGELDDVEDRDELRKRFEMLLQEVRVVLPGVQVLSAFLLTAPFSQRFDKLDEAGRWCFGVALVTSMISVVCLLGPTLLHRVGERTARAERLTWSVRMLIVGLACLAVALLSGMWGITRFVFGTGTASWMAAPVALLVVLAWIALPLTLRRHTARRG